MITTQIGGLPPGAPGPAGWQDWLVEFPFPAVYATGGVTVDVTVILSTVKFIAPMFTGSIAGYFVELVIPSSLLNTGKFKVLVRQGLLQAQPGDEIAAGTNLAAALGTLTFRVYGTK